MSKLNANAPEFHPASPQIYPLLPPPYNPPPVMFQPPIFNGFNYDANQPVYIYDATAAFFTTSPTEINFVAASSSPAPPPTPVYTPTSHGRHKVWFPRDDGRGNYVQNRAGEARGPPNNGVEGSGRSQNNTRGRYIQRPKSRHEVMPLELDPNATTVMIKNIPYDCTRSELIDVLDGFCLKENTPAKNEGSSQSPQEEEPVICAYDFAYQPFDFKTKKGRGFAFVNFTNAATVKKFSSSFQGTLWENGNGNGNGKNWERPIEIVKAKIQGREAFVEKALLSLYDCDSDEFLPVTFEPARDGSGNPVEMTVVGNRRGSRRSGVGNSSSSGN
ncbi:protein MEI2-like 6 [Andrographis paniculata]|uniref:protein MEI2-like 6 n=1 Tax=Andrographis paniculata TaxID=175694 RepID=UPI0021E776E4|nr:protein MEI2-like 6 [Andrographis paniculata]